MKFGELQIGETFQVVGDSRVYMKIFSGFSHMNAVIIKSSCQVRVGYTVSFNDVEVIRCGHIDEYHYQR